ncbi:hypothetical protein [Solimicrobium silvestre]|uniref:Uncharacterized protein n=1 Tax=Solimicrobium silvestre TaxID=2099400 RepID=A0A2S9GTF8_9BURK|nr:hypothetical protein [Solimicrobium silvestre]PRC90995.1 hypothetical protein S2091_4291 [Solimicrobium silvestre]
MSVSLINDHLSFRPATDIFKVWDQGRPTPPNSPLALRALAEAKAAIQHRQVENKSPLTAQLWGVTPAGVRRNILRAAGLEDHRWDCPVHSFSDAERIAMKAAAEHGVRLYERASHAI